MDTSMTESNTANYPIYTEPDSTPGPSTSPQHDTIHTEDEDLTLDDTTHITEVPEDGSTEQGTQQQQQQQQPREAKKTSRKLRIFEKTGPQATVGQIRDLRLLTKFVKDFEINITQKEIDDYLGFKERTSRRLRKVKTKSELVAEGLLERHPRADNAKKPKTGTPEKGDGMTVSKDNKVSKEPRKRTKKGKDGEMQHLEQPPPQLGLDQGQGQDGMPGLQQHQQQQHHHQQQHSMPEHPSIPNGYAEAWPNQLDPTLFQQP